MKQRQKFVALGASLLSATALAVGLLAGEPGAPDVRIGELNQGTILERSLCLTVGLAAGASECGDLRLAHALPSVRTFNQERTPVLMYNSQHASPHPIVAANVSLPSGTSGLSRVVATLKVNGTPRAQGVWRGSAWPAGSQPVRIAVGYDAARDPTGPYRYTLEVEACYATACAAATVPGQLAVVNRRTSPFGAGWWLAGVERLELDPFGKPMLWVGGDGSTRRYAAARGDSVWGAPSLDQPDTLKREGDGWVRLLSGGGVVRFDAAGRHVATRNRLGHTTEFWYNSAGRLDSIGVPPQVTREGDVTPKRLIRPYIFVYGADGQLSRVDAPGSGTAPRVTRVHGSAGRVDSIADPDGTRVRFGYPAASSPRIASRTDRRRYRTDFRYDAGYRIAGSKLWMDTLALGDSIVTRVRAAEALGLATREGTGAFPAAEAYAQVDGPRTDVADQATFWLDRWGAPRRIVNALNEATELTRGDPRFPALVTRVQSPNGRVVGAEYDERGNITTSTDSSRSRVESDGTIRHATTRYEWDAKWDVVTKVTLPEGEVTTFGYDGSTGNRIWQQVGSDPARRVTFTYESEGATQGMLATSMAPGGQKPDSVAYDRLGNLALVVSPKGARAEYLRDGIGRDSVTLVPLDDSAVQRHELRYVPGTDLVELGTTRGPAMNGRGAQTVQVRNEYDANGNVTAVERWSTPDVPTTPIGRIRTRWRYDAAGRAVAEIAPGSGTVTDTWFEEVCEGDTEDSCTQVPRDSTYTVEYRDSTLYDPAGNPLEVHTRRANPATGAPLVIRMRYDALGRLEQRIVPQVHYNRARVQGIPAHYRSSSTPQCTGAFAERSYPSRPNDGGCGYRIEEDVQTFRYDAVGNVTLADNRDAQIRREYNLDGTLRIDSLRIRTMNGADFSRHAYGLEFRYDLNGRRVELRHPAQLAASPAQATVAYGYDPATGALTDVTDPLGNVFRYEYNMRGELHRKVFDGAGWDEYGFDEGGALTGHRTFRLEEQVPGENFRRFELLRGTEIVRDAQGRLKQSSNSVGRRDTITATYSGLGHLVRTTAALYGDATQDPTLRGGERFAYDALGNLSSDTSSQSVKSREGRNDTDIHRTSGYTPGTDRLSWKDQTTQLDPVAILSRTVRPTITLRNSFLYDASGNLEFSTQSYRSSGSCSSQEKKDADCEDRVSFYAADGSLRAAEHRVRMGEDNGNYWRDTFEEYRYDALGRRVWVRSQVVCPSGTPTSGWPLVPCYSAVRRTIWDGDAELWEIQMPGQDASPHLENDTQPLPVQTYNPWFPDPNSPDPVPGSSAGYAQFDPNPRYGRVAYTHGLGVDQPLSLVRIGLNRYYPADRFVSGSVAQAVTFAPFAAMPLTDWRGHVDGALYAGGRTAHCQTFSGTERCTRVVGGQAWSAYGQEDPAVLEWHGTLLTGKRDATGTLFRRARYYDPQTGRFTQEDPIGLAGGLNLYGYASGDPINLSDPSGLCPVCVGAAVGALTGALVYRFTVPASQRTGAGYLAYAAGGALAGGALGGLYGLAAPAVGGAGAGAGAGAAATGTAVVGEVTQVSSGLVALDTNALIAAVEGSPAVQAAVTRAIAGRVPAVSRTAIREFMVKGNAQALREYMYRNGVVILAEGEAWIVQGLIGIGLKQADAHVVASAIQRGVSLLTNDKRILNKLIPGVSGF